MSNRRANYEIVERTPEKLVIYDVGPWNEYLTVTNAAEDVVDELIKSGTLKPDQRLFYYDSEGECDEILHKNGRFTGFAPGEGRS